MSFLPNNTNGTSNFRKRLSSLSLKKKSNQNSNYFDYYYLNQFDNIDEKSCIKYDNINEEIYSKNIQYYSQCNKFLNEKKANFSVGNSPKPPRKPSNHQLYLSYKMRNVSKNVINQSLAIVYLLNKNYNLILESDKYKNEEEMINKMVFEPYMAIELAEKISNENNENYKDAINNNKILDGEKNFNPLPPYNQNDRTVYNNYLFPIQQNVVSSTNNTQTSPSAPPASHSIQRNNIYPNINQTQT